MSVTSAVAGQEDPAEIKVALFSAEHAKPMWLLWLPLRSGCFSAGTQEFKAEEGKKHVTFGDHVESHPWFGDWIGEMDEMDEMDRINPLTYKFHHSTRTRTFTVEEDESWLPWQLAGEPDIKLVSQK